MKKILRKIAYMSVLMAMTLLMGERIVPHHHCDESAISGYASAGTIHFGYGECEECEHRHCGDDHTHSEEKCCDDSQLLFRIAENGNDLIKKVITFNSSCFILFEQSPLPTAHQHGFYSCYCRLKIPDTGAPYTALRAPPVA